jgi:hypothetical protein
MARWYSEDSDFTEISKEEKEVRDRIVEIMNRYSRDMSRSNYYSSDYGVQEDDFEDVADKIMREFKIK